MYQPEVCEAKNAFFYESKFLNVFLGGASLELLEGKDLPGVTGLSDKSAK